MGKAPGDHIGKWEKKWFYTAGCQFCSGYVFILSGYWGIRNFGKLQNDQSVYMYYLNELKIFLENLR
jgi:hypothetical protein